MTSRKPCLLSAFGEDEYEDDITYDQVFDHVPDYLVSRESLDKARKTLEPQDPIFLSDYLGQFPSGSTSKMVVPRSALESAMLTWTERKRPLGPRIGVDIGTGGADPCVAVMYMDGEKIVEHEWRPDSDDSEAQVTIASTIQGLAVRWGADLGEGDWDWDGQPIPGERVSIDASGMVGVADILSSRVYHVDPRPVDLYRGDRAVQEHAGRDALGCPPGIAGGGLQDRPHQVPSLVAAGHLDDV